MLVAAVFSLLVRSPTEPEIILPTYSGPDRFDLVPGTPWSYRLDQWWRYPDGRPCMVEMISFDPLLVAQGVRFDFSQCLLTYSGQELVSDQEGYFVMVPWTHGYWLPQAGL